MADETPSDALLLKSSAQRASSGHVSNTGAPDIVGHITRTLAKAKDAGPTPEPNPQTDRVPMGFASRPSSTVERRAKARHQRIDKVRITPDCAWQEFTEVHATTLAGRSLHWDGGDNGRMMSLKVTDGRGGCHRFYVDAAGWSPGVKAGDDPVRVMVRGADAGTVFGGRMTADEAIAWAEERAGNPDLVRRESAQQNRRGDFGGAS